MPRSKVAGFGGGGLPVVIAAVRVLDRRLREFCVRRIVQAGEVDRVKFAAERGKRAALGERPDAAPAAKEKMEEGSGFRPGCVLVVRQDVGSLQQAKCVALCEGHPEPRLAAERAIAARRAGGQIEVAFKPDSAAMAAAFVGFFHSSVSCEVPAGVIACSLPAASREQSTPPPTPAGGPDGGAG